MPESPSNELLVFSPVDQQQPISEDLRQKLSRIRVLIMDVDGTLTDGAMYYSAAGEMMKRFSTRDGMGISLLHRAGIRTAILTSEQSAIVSARAEKLQIAHVVLGSRNKTASLHLLAEQISCDLGEIAYIGDDVNDEGPMQLCGFTACPADAVACIQALADYRCVSNGGHGAVREVAEVILTTQGKPTTLPQAF